MKQIVKTSRLAGLLEKAYRLLNIEIFDGQLPQCVITISPSSRSYAHYSVLQIWNCRDAARHEINISSTYLNRPIEAIIASLVHEMVHCYCNAVLNVQDVSNKSMYHNSVFRREAELHGLNVQRHERWGWCITSPGDRLLEFIIDHMDELREIEMSRSEPLSFASASGGAGAAVSRVPTNSNAHHRKYVCMSCGCSCRATRTLHILCIDCGLEMVTV